ncbi:MAG: HEAT repeat domain-containing protein, partial [Elusimicrobiota bacterium]
ALVRVGDQRAVEPLIKELANRSPSVLALAAKALGTLGDKRAVNPLEEALKDEAKEVRKAAAAALGKIRPAP